MQFLACLGVVGLLAGPTPLRSDEVSVQASAAAEVDWPKIREQTFTTVWETINTSYYDPTFGGVDWTAVREKYHALLPPVADNSALRPLLQHMLGELHQSHFAILPREMAVYTPAERVRIGTVGAEVVCTEGEVVVSRVKPDSPAAQAGLRPGDRVVKVGEQALAELRDYMNSLGLDAPRVALHLAEFVSSRLRAGVGTAIPLVVQHEADPEERVCELVSAANDGQWSEPVGSFPSMPVECFAQVGPDGIARLRFNVFARQVMPDIRALLRQIPADGGLVIDLRGNPGGITVMASGISGWLSDRTFLMGTMHMREGRMSFTVSPQKNAFLGPVAVLIDSRSVSTSEIMAAGLQEAGRARIFGETSPGAALPSVCKDLPNGDLLQYAIADLQTPAGVLIEGRGVRPDEPVQRTRADLAAGRDPVMTAAEHWLDAERKKNKVVGP